MRAPKGSALPFWRLDVRRPEGAPIPAIAQTPPLVGRGAELEAIAERLKGASEGRGAFVCFHAPAGTGKTRLLDEAMTAARTAGFDAARGTALAEAVTLYQPWAEALAGLKLDSLMREEPPPKLLGLYLLSGGGVLVAKAERQGLTVDADLFASMSSAVADFVSESLPGAPSGENVLRLAHGSRGICVVREPGFALTAVFEGRESETFLVEVRRLAGEIDKAAGERLRGWDGDANKLAGAELPLRWTLESGRWSGDEQPLEGGARKFNLFENVRAGLDRAAQRRPLLIAFDDLHWADPSSLALLRYLARNLRSSRAVILASYRPEEAARRAEFSDAIAAMARESLVEDRALAPLTEGESRTLCERMLGPSKLPSDFLVAVACEAECNPLFMREVLEGLLEEGTIAREPASGELVLTRPVERLKVPERVRDVVAQRLRRLSADERALLDAAAVCGTRFEGALVAKVMGEPEARVLRGLNALARGHGLVRAEARAWTFDHPLLREVVYAEISLDLRELYHRQAAEAISAAGGPPEVIGDHFAAGGDVRAVGPLRAGAKAALERGAPEEAARHLGRAVEAAPEAEKAALFEERASALEVAGRYADAVDAIAAAERAGGPKVRLLRRRLAILDKLSRFEEALALANQATASMQPAEAALIDERRAVLLLHMGRLKEAKAEAEEALRWLPANEPIPRAGATQVLAEAAWSEGRYKEGLTTTVELARLLEEAGDRRGHGAALSNLGSTFHQLGDLDAALDNYRKSLAISEAIGDRYGVSACLNNIGLVHLDRGEVREARHAFDRSLDLSESLGDPGGRGTALQNIGTMEIMAGEAGSAEGRFLAALDLARKSSDVPGLSAALVNLGAAHARLGRPKEALEDLDAAVAYCREHEERQVLCAALIERVMPLLSTGALEAAADSLGEGRAIAEGSHLATEVGLASRAQAELDSARGKPDASRAAFEDALRHFESLDGAYEVAETKFRWALAESAWGNHEAARNLGGAAGVAFERLGLPRRAEEARRVGGA